MSDKFSVDDILAELSNEKEENKVASPNANNGIKKEPSVSAPGATMILNSIDEKKKMQDESRKDVTREISPEKLQHLKAVVNEGQRRPKETPPAQKPAVNQPEKPAASETHYRRLSEFDEEDAKPVKRKLNIEKNTHDTDFAKPSVKQNSQNEVAVKEKPAENVKKAEKKAGNSSKTIFSDTDEKRKDKSEKVSVSINTSANMTFRDKIKQNRFLFEELTKRDFKKKYKRTVLGVLWSIISPFLTFLVQYFVFGYIFHRLDSGFVIYLLTGTLMFNFFTNATTNGMFSMYSNGPILSKVKVPKSLFVLSSNSAATFNFFLTLIVYFIFMIFCQVTFGIHLLMMIFPILCLIIFNIGMSYILSALFVFFRDMQYLYQIFTMLLMYMSAIFYEVKHFPEELRFVFNINPIYHYISYMRELVIGASVPSLTEHIICLAFAFGMLGVGYFVHSKTEQKFVYYY